MNRRPRVLAVASGGGHWVQLLRLEPAFSEADVTYVSVRPEYAEDVSGRRFICVRDATRWNKFLLIVLAAQLLWIVIRVRPDVVISTGAAPGYFAIRVAKLLRKKTVWIDSIANVEQVSMTCRVVSRSADVVLTQWAHLEGSLDGTNPKYAGAVL